MTQSLSALQQAALALAASGGFAGSTLAFRVAFDASDPRWTIGAMTLLMGAYIPFLSLLGQSMTATIVVTGLLSQSLALMAAFAVYGEPVTPLRALGLVAAALAMLAFAIPVPVKP